jgi:hypothetical protein
MDSVCVCVPRCPFGCLSSASQRECVRPRSSALLCAFAGCISASGRRQLPAFPCRCSCRDAARSFLAQARLPCLSASAESLPSAPSLNRYLCCHVRSQPSVGWECTLAPYPASDNVTARGRRRGPVPPVHLNPLRSYLSMRSSPLPLLQFPAPLVYPFLCVLSGYLPFCPSVPCDSLCRCMASVLVLIARFASPGRHQLLLGGTSLSNAAGTASPRRGPQIFSFLCLRLVSLDPLMKVACRV